MSQKIIPFKRPEPVIDSDYFGSETLPITDLLQALDEVKRRKQEAFNDANIIIRYEDS